MGGSTQPQSQTTTINNPGQSSLIGLGLPFAQQFAANPPQAPNFSLVAPFDPLQTQGQNAALAASGTQQGIANTGADLAKFLSGDVLNPNTNPALAATIDASTRPITEQLTQSVLPAIRGAATQAGQFGSSRQGIAEGLATNAASRAVGDTAAKVATQGYQSGLDALTKNLALLPQTSNLQLLPALTTSGVGDVRQQLAQSLLGEQGAQYQYNQLLPLLMAQSLIGLGSAIPTQSVTSTATQPQGNPIMQALGLGISALPFLPF